MNPIHLMSMIEVVLSLMDPVIPHTVVARELLFLTACVESDCGYYYWQQEGPALGIFQMERTTAEDIWNRYLNKNFELKRVVLFIVLGADRPLTRLWWAEKAYLLPIDIEFSLKYNLAFQIAMARVKYWMSPRPLPVFKDADMAIYWKDIYNTNKGKGKITDAMWKYNHYKESV